MGVPLRRSPRWSRCAADATDRRRSAYIHVLQGLGYLVDSSRAHMLWYGYGRVFGHLDRFGGAIRVRAGVLGLPAEAAVAGGIRVPALRRADGVVDDTAPAGLQRLPTPGLGDGGHDFPGHAQASDPLVPSDVVGHRPKAWRERPGTAAGARAW